MMICNINQIDIDNLDAHGVHEYTSFPIVKRCWFSNSSLKPHNDWIKNYRFGRIGVFVEVSLAEFGQCTPGNKWYQRLREL
jgi:hypothetical protein